jgi:vacuolar-type H+-ATPase subunit H
MEMNLENLISKLKNEAVEDARKTGMEIKQQAQKEADDILEKARSEAERMKTDAEQQSLKYHKNAELAIASGCERFPAEA